jgi:hypothetical protein
LQAAVKHPLPLPLLHQQLILQEEEEEEEEEEEAVPRQHPVLD